MEGRSSETSWAEENHWTYAPVGASARQARVCPAPRRSYGEASGLSVARRVRAARARTGSDQAGRTAPQEMIVFMPSATEISSSISSVLGRYMKKPFTGLGQV